MKSLKETMKESLREPLNRIILLICSGYLILAVVIPITTDYVKMWIHPENYKEMTIEDIHKMLHEDDSKYSDNHILKPDAEKKVKELLTPHRKTIKSVKPQHKGVEFI